MSGGLHISSLVVQTKPENFGEVRGRLLEMGAEIPASDPCGKLVVVIETKSEAEINGFLNEVAVSKGVLSASLVYHLVEGEETAETSLAAGPSQQQGETS
jgi:nitrate reductase NapAB chaperone NapD